MDFFTNEKQRPYLIGTVIVLFMLIALAIRMIPSLFVQSQGFFHSFDPDTWYNLRQIEVMVSNFPQYNWFDPMTAYPTGKIIDWGPGHPFLVALLCLITGAASRAEIVNCAGWVSPIIAAIMVPITYKLGKMIWDWKAGLLSAGFISVLSLQYFTGSAYGVIDHHIAEVLFTTLFFLAYIFAIIALRTRPIDLNEPKTLIIPALLSLLPAILYFFGYLSSPTVLIALLVVGIYTVIQYIYDYTKGARVEYLLFQNGLLFSFIAVLVVIFGFPQDAHSLTTYSIEHVYVMLALIAENIVLYGLSRLFAKNRLNYFLSLAAILISGYILLFLLPVSKTISDQAVSLVWGQSAYSLYVLETQQWTLSTAFDSFNLALLLMAGGFILLLWHSVKKGQNAHILLLVWFAVLLVLTIPHQRFQVYLTVPAALLSGMCVTETIRWSLEGKESSLSSLLSWKAGNSDSEAGQEGSKKKGRRNKETASRPGAGISPGTALKGMTLTCIVIMAILVFVFSAGNDIRSATNSPEAQISQDWIGTLEWLNINTPLTGVNYYQNYNQQTFTYPNESYGIMAPWAAGHQITFLSNRIPITNPFQDNLAGGGGAAAFYLSPDEGTANTILSSLGGKYVITDLRTTTDTFLALPPWIGSSVNTPTYFTWFFVKTPTGLVKNHMLNDPYFQTTLVRLQMFDGSLVLPTTAEYTQYVVEQVPDSGETAYMNGQARVITGQKTITASDTGSLALIPEDTTLVTGKNYAGVFSSIPYKPVQKVPALTHYRLVHESPNNISVILGYGYDTLPDLKSVKVFEYVKGAHIPGEGVIELNLVTNTGRTFVYCQESSNGEFVVPYATEGGTGEGKATGPYHIQGTTRSISVTEADVVNGNTVSG